MNAVVTGASGHIGVNLVRALVERGDAVRALVHVDVGPLEDLDVEIVRGDVCDSSSLLPCFRGAHIVYHLAGHISVSCLDSRNDCRVNVDGVRAVVDASIECGVPRLVHFSSVHAAMDACPGAEVDEETPLVDGEDCPPYD